MAFHYVDRILAFEAGKRMVGIKNVTRTEPYLHHLPDGRTILNPMMVSEAAAQLGGWLLMEATDFRERAILLADEYTAFPHYAEPGDRIVIEVELVSRDDEVCVTRGTARVGDHLVLDGECCRGYLLPMTDLCDPSSMRRRFERIYKPEFANVPAVEGFRRNGLLKGSNRGDPLLYLDGVQRTGANRVLAYKNLTSQEGFFEAHFPLKPMVPGVIQLTMITEAAQVLGAANQNPDVRDRILLPTFTKNVRLRKFIEPGDRVEIVVELAGGDPRISGSEVSIRGALMANGRRVMQCEMGFQVESHVSLQRSDRRTSGPYESRPTG